MFLPSPIPKYREVFALNLGLLPCHLHPFFSFGWGWQKIHWLYLLWDPPLKKSKNRKWHLESKLRTRTWKKKTRKTSHFPLSYPSSLMSFAPPPPRLSFLCCHPSISKEEEEEERETMKSSPTLTLISFPLHFSCLVSPFFF